MEIYCDKYDGEHHTNFILKNNHCHWPRIMISGSKNPLFSYSSSNRFYCRDTDKCTHELPDDGLMEIINSRLLRMQNIYSDIEECINDMFNKQNILSADDILSIISEKNVSAKYRYAVNLDNETIESCGGLKERNSSNYDSLLKLIYIDNNGNHIRIKCDDYDGGVDQLDINTTRLEYEVELCVAPRLYICFHFNSGNVLKINIQPTRVDGAFHNIIKILHLLNEIADMNNRGFHCVPTKSSYQRVNPTRLKKLNFSN